MQVLGNRYQVGELLGQGGMAQVYHAHDRVLDRPVAVKILRPEYAADTTLVARFEREARAAASLVYPNIVAVHDVGQDGDIYYIVMEYMAGPTLKEVIRQRAPLTIEFTLKVAEQVCAALEHAHRRGLIHRDIKPQNLLLNEDEDIIKVTDFGIAKSTLDPEITTENLAMGTVKYVSPEQALGQEVVPQSDLYSLGVVLYEMLTGKQPFDGETPVSIVRQHAESPPRPPRQLNPYIPPALEGLILRALNKNPQERFASAREMQLALERYRLTGAEVTGPLPAATPGRAPAPYPAETPARAQAPYPAETSGMRTPQAFPPRHAPSRPQAGLGAVGVILLVLIATGIIGLLAMAPQVLPVLFPPPPTATPTATPPPPTPRQVAVPDLRGYTAAEARTRLESFGLRYAQGEARYDPYILPGQVVAQEPTYSIYVDEGTVVTVFLGEAPTLVRIPDVVQMSYPGAKLSLEQTGFRVEMAEIGCTGTPAGYVDRQEPRGGRQEIQGITITVYVSTGDQSVMPEILRVPLEEARQRIAEASLSLRWEQAQTQADMPPGVRIDDLGAPGQVISYRVYYGGRTYDSGTLRPGDRVPCGATIDVAFYATSP